MEPEIELGLADERTFLAWSRTALALFGTGCAILRFTRGVAGQSLGAAMTVFGALTWLGGWRKYRSRVRSSAPSGHGASPVLLRAFATGMSFVTLGALVVALSHGR